MDMGQDPRRIWWRLLGWSFLLGALVDFSFGVGALAFPQQLGAWFAVALPPRRVAVHADLNGLLLIGLGAIYLQVFRDPRRLVSVAATATLLRFGGFALFYGDVLAGKAERFFLLVGSVDAALAMVHLLLIRLAAGSLVGALIGKERAT